MVTPIGAILTTATGVTAVFSLRSRGHQGFRCSRLVTGHGACGTTSVIETTANCAMYWARRLFVDLERAYMHSRQSENEISALMPRRSRFSCRCICICSAATLRLASSPSFPVWVRRVELNSHPGGKAWERGSIAYTDTSEICGELAGRANSLSN